MITLYDLVGANDRRFSPFCWRTKAVLAYKNIPYTTVPIRFSDKDKLAFSGQDRVPVITHNGTVVYDSWTIARYLEEQQPDPKIFPGLGLKEACRFFNLYMDRAPCIRPCCRWCWPTPLRRSIPPTAPTFALRARSALA